MKISIRSTEEHKRFSFYLPLGFIKTRLAARIILSIDDENNVTSKAILELQEQIKEAYHQLKQYVRKNGHFYLIEGEDKEGNKVRIRV
ncbi:MAG: hypothetical protein J5618_02880 [Bacilli bacterium]|nr:hypothetical protein [Bacilli bacterium]